MNFTRTVRDAHFMNLGGLMLEVVDHSKYLRSIFTTDNEVKEDIKIRIAAASNCSWAISEILKSRILSRSTKTQAYNTFNGPIATYGCETWSMIKGLERMLAAY